VADFELDAILVFAAGASGNAAPIREVQGSATMLDCPNSLVIQ
jgi:hypothetical protein